MKAEKLLNSYTENPKNQAGLRFQPSHKVSEPSSKGSEREGPLAPTGFRQSGENTSSRISDETLTQSKE